MALFDTPFRHVPHIDPADRRGDAEVAVVDSTPVDLSTVPVPAASHVPDVGSSSAIADLAPGDPVPSDPHPAADPPDSPISPISPEALKPAVIQPAVVVHGVEIAAPEPQAIRPAADGSALTVFSRVVAPGSGAAAPGDALRLISAIDETDPVLDQLRSLAASLHQARTGRELRIIAVTSSVSGEGKTLLAANLALTLSRSYMRQVLLIDADLRRPNLHRLFNTRSGQGLPAALDAVREGRAVAVQEVAPRLALLPAGKPTRDPISVLASDAMQRLMAGATSAFDWIVIDTPPVGMLPDAGLLASLSDAVLLVVESGRVRYDLVQRSAESIGADRIFGVVLNKVPERELVAAYGANYYAPYR